MHRSAAHTPLAADDHEVQAQMHIPSHTSPTIAGMHHLPPGLGAIALSDAAVAGLYYVPFTDVSLGQYQYALSDFMNIPLSHNFIGDEHHHHTGLSGLHHGTENLRETHLTVQHPDYRTHHELPQSHFTHSQQQRVDYHCAVSQDEHTQPMLTKPDDRDLQLDADVCFICSLSLAATECNLGLLKCPS